MSLLSIVIAVLLIIFALWLVQTYINAPFRTPALVIIVVLALVWICIVALVPALSTVRVR